MCIFALVPVSVGLDIAHKQTKDPLAVYDEGLQAFDPCGLMLYSIDKHADPVLHNTPSKPLMQRKEFVRLC